MKNPETAKAIEWTNDARDYTARIRAMIDMQALAAESGGNTIPCDTLGMYLVMVLELIDDLESSLSAVTDILRKLPEDPARCA